MKSAAWTVINLEALKFNLNRARELAVDSKVMVVIKANGYGHGLCEVAEALKQADAFAVARVDEAVQLRKAGFEQRIAVLEGFSDAEELRLHSKFQLEAVIYTPEQLTILEENSQFNPPHFWLKIDTGMHRLGIEPKALHFFYKQLSKVAPVSVMTHFACADELDNSMTAQQLALFNEATADCSAEKSLANSAAIMGWPEIKAEWVRPGIMLYGISPFEGQQGEMLGLKPVMNLYSKLISIKEVKKGDSVGYGASYRCENDCRIGVVAIGYGDGYPRHNKSARSVLLNGQRVSLVGRVSMDMITIDLSAQPEAAVGDVCQLWGEGLSVEEVAESADTIAYTLVCGVARRVKMYYQIKDEVL